MESGDVALVCVLVIVGIMLLGGGCTVGMQMAQPSEPITETKFTEMYCPECGAPLEFELEICEED